MGNHFLKKKENIKKKTLRILSENNLDEPHWIFNGKLFIEKQQTIEDKKLQRLQLELLNTSQISMWLFSKTRENTAALLLLSCVALYAKLRKWDLNATRWLTHVLANCLEQLPAARPTCRRCLAMPASVTETTLEFWIQGGLFVIKCLFLFSFLDPQIRGEGGELKPSQPPLSNVGIVRILESCSRFSYYRTNGTGMSTTTLCSRVSVVL